LIYVSVAQLRICSRVILLTGGVEVFLKRFIYNFDQLKNIWM